ncbi:MAG: acetyl-CoA carboxylase biotin carboxyl carrier protein subunit [Bacteroidota bacterium]|nr:acetyl-CoA carboxylase biotin carboxyl carrier protein subunit [Bacteroidota bacterium]
MAAKKEKEKDIKLDIFNFEGTKYRTHLPEKFLNRKVWEPKDSNKVFSPIAGTISKINVKVGQKVSKGRCLYILESMKMKNRFNAEKPAIIAKIHIHEGEVIPRKLLVIELEDLPPKKTVRSLSSIKKSKK